MVRLGCKLTLNSRKFENVMKITDDNQRDRERTQRQRKMRNENIYLLKFFIFYIFGLFNC